MSRPPRSLLYAADRYPRRGAQENRLTEIFAEVLRTSPRLSRWLAAIAFEVEAIDEDARMDVTTQFQLAGGAERPDIRVTLEGGPHRTPRTFYIEDKLDALFTAAQQSGYPNARNAPIVLIASKQRPEAHESFIQITWSEVAREAWVLGVDSTSPGLAWLDYAWTPDAPSEVRMLAELVAYLEREMGVRPQASLTTKDLEVLPDAHAVVSRWEGLFTLIEQELSQNPGLRATTARFGSDGWVGPLGTGWDLRLNPPNCGWPALDAHWERHEQDAPTKDDRFSCPSLLMAPSAPWDPGADRVPSTGVGMTVGCTNGWPDGLREGDELYNAARKRGFTLGITGGDRGRIFRTRALAALTTYPTLQDQAEDIVQWARRVREEFRTLGQ